MLQKIVSRVVLCAALFMMAPGGGAQSQAPSVPRLDFRERTLTNGLRFFAIEDHASPTVAIQVWYHVGSKDDPAGRSGFAHLFEHIMFKSTKNMKSEMLDRLTEDVGGFNNAFTSDDVTVYHEVVPSNYLETLIWAEADRLASLTVDDGNFVSERDVVKEEYRQAYLAQPYGRLSLAIQQQSFAAHPYKRGVIGNLEELNAAAIADVRAFHTTYYRPDNATLVVAGDFNPAQLDAWVDKYFGRIARPQTPLPRVTIKEPARAGSRRHVEYAPNVPLPAVAITYLVPPAASSDAFAIEVAEAILSGGESSRLYRALVYEQQIAASAELQADLREDHGLAIFEAVAASGKKVEQIESSLLSEIKKMQIAPPTAAELAKAKNQLLTEELGERETSQGKCLALGQAAMLLGDPHRVNTDLAKLQAVTAADVQRVMQKYFTESNRLVIHYLPAPEGNNSARATQRGGAQ